MAGGSELSYRGRDPAASEDKVNMAPNSDKTAIRATSCECSPNLGFAIVSEKIEPMSIEMDGQEKPVGQPQNFGVVAPGMYRSSFPEAEDLPFLEGLKLKTIVTLVQKDFSKHFHDFVDKHGITHHIVEMKGTKKEEIPAEIMGTILELVLDKSCHPVLIHCKQGRHRTGCVVGVLRKMSGWNLGSILDEYKTYAEPKPRDCDITYLTGFQPSRFPKVVADHTIHDRSLTWINTIKKKAWSDLTVRGRVTLILSTVIFMVIMMCAARPDLCFPHPDGEGLRFKTESSE